MEGKRVRAALHPGQRGTKRLVKKYGVRLLCVRYRYDEEKARRLTTVELVEDSGPWTSPVSNQPVWVQIHGREKEQRQQVKSAGGFWDPALKLWRLPRNQVNKLGLRDRIVSDREISSENP